MFLVRLNEPAFSSLLPWVIPHASRFGDHLLRRYFTALIRMRNRSRHNNIMSRSIYYYYDKREWMVVSINDEYRIYYYINYLFYLFFNNWGRHVLLNEQNPSSFHFYSEYLYGHAAEIPSFLEHINDHCCCCAFLSYLYP